MNEQGQTIQKLKMDAVNSDRQFLEFVGSVALPNVPFRVAVIGRDSNDKQYQRFFASLFHAESVEVSASPDFDELSPGSTRQVAFKVRNIGSPRTFKFTVTDTQKFLTNVAPKELALGAGESGNFDFQVELTVPAATASGVGDDLVIVAASTTGPPTSNSSVVHLSVSVSNHNPP